MIALSPPPSPASRFESLIGNTSGGGSNSRSGSAGGGMEAGNNGYTAAAHAVASGSSPRLNQRSLLHEAHQQANSSNRSSPSPRLQARQLLNHHHHPHQSYTYTTATTNPSSSSPSAGTSSSPSSSSLAPRPAQLQRLHAQSSSSSSSSSSTSSFGGGAAPAPATGSAGHAPSSMSTTQFSGPSPLYTSSSFIESQQTQLLSPPLQGSPASLSVASPLSSPARGGHIVGAAAAAPPYPHAHAHAYARGAGAAATATAAGRSSSPPLPMTPTSPVAGSLLFSQSPSSLLDGGVSTGHAQHPQQHHHQSLPTPTTTAASPRPFTRLNSIGVGVASPRSHHSNNASVPHSPALPTARPPLSFHHTGSSSSGSGNERHHHHYSHHQYDSQSQYHHQQQTTKGTHSTALARSATRSPPPPPNSSSSATGGAINSSSSAYHYGGGGSQQQHHHYMGNNNTHYASSYRAASPESSVASSAFAYTASNTTNNLSHAFHSALQQQQQQQHHQHSSTTGTASSSSQLVPQSAFRRGGGETTSSSSHLNRVAGSSASLASSSNNLYASSTASSRHPSRRPSLATLQSFLEGVNHVTRVRSPSLRGHSRCGSFDDFGSVVGGGAASSVFSLSSNRGESQPWHLDDVDEVPSWEEHNRTFSSTVPTPNSPTPRNRTLLTGFSARYNRDISSALTSRRDLFTPDNEYGPSSMQTSPVPIPLGGGGGGRAHSGDEFNDDYDEYAERTFVDRRDMTLFPDHIRDEDEQRHLRNLEEQEGGIYRDEPYGSGMQEEHIWTEQDLNSLQEGDRLGIGLTHEGYPIVDALETSPESPFRTPDDGIQFEIVRQLGYGSYAIVYLVKEILYEPSDEDDHLFPGETDAGREGENGDQHQYHQQRIYGREFALKCLSKKNLSDEQITVQKFEATLHRALPTHPNVVALHRAMETPAWLFLVLEYCPGQDLFFWLEQARDHDDIDMDPSRAPSRMSSRAPQLPSTVIQKAWQHTSSAAPSPPLGQSPFSRSFEEKHESTPPSPSLLSANADTALLSRRRLRLISRMFVQMCEAMQACHDAGVAHRDIKPENIIIVDNRAELGSSGRVVIKLTDWGLGTTDERCEDFDCGSKPYMAYECRNNLMPSYEPKGADVWSLGIVLLNLLFHRCPWADPTLDDPDFCAFRRDPIGFLETRFEGIGTEVATFLANKVFCDVVEEDEIPFSSPESVNAPLPSSVATATPLSIRRSQSSKPVHKVRVTAGEFAKWANKLVRYMGEGSRRASISDATYQMVSSVRQSPRIDGAGGGSVAGGVGARPFHSPPARSPRNSIEIQRLVDASPSRKAKRLSVGLPNDLIEELENGQLPSHAVISTTSPTPPSSSLLSQLAASAPEHTSPLASTSLEEATRNLSMVTSDGVNDDNPHARHQRVHDETFANGHSPDMEVLADGKDLTTDEADVEAAAAKERHRRRKRGARRGKGQHRENGEGSEPPLSPSRSRSGTMGEHINGDETYVGGVESPIINLVETSETLQAYAREISQSTKGPAGALDIHASSGDRSGRPSSATSTVTLPSTRSAAPNTTTKSRFADKLKSAFANGNPELQAFAARAKERDMLIGGAGARNPTASAPAKMQHSSAYQASSSQISSFGSVASSAGSWSEDGGAGRHWASTSSRRTRVSGGHKHSADDQTRSAADGDTVSLGGLHASRPGRPARTSRHHQISREQASTVNSSPSPSRRSFTPLSSFSSVTSYDAQSAGSHGQSSSSPSGLAAAGGRSLRSPLHSIEETANAYGRSGEKNGFDDENGDTATPLSASTVLDSARPVKLAPSSQPQVIREPKAPPTDGFQSSTGTSKPSLPNNITTASQPEAPTAGNSPSAPRARIGKFFGKFGRG